MGLLHAFLILSALSAQPKGLEALSATPPNLPSHQVRSVRVTVLSTMLTDLDGVGEWGFAALVEVDGHRLLFDTGARPQTVLDNARELGIDLSDVTDVVLSHHHWDHTGGLIALREALSKESPAALSRAHVAEGIFLSRPSPTDGQERNTVIAVRAAYEAAGGRFLIHFRPVEIVPGVWLTGPVPRPHAERNWPRAGRLLTPEGLVEDSIPEDASLIINTQEGLVVITGCGHAGSSIPLSSRVALYRFFFYSNEGSEPRHMHVQRERNLAKFWLDPVQLASSHGFRARELRKLERIVTENRQRFLEAWDDFFGS